jgi:hypothetical protein
MGHFAKVENGIVTQVIVAEQYYIDTLSDASSWVQTSYNTYGGVHRFGGTPLRKNYAGAGYTYDSERDAFIAPQPFPSWVLNEQSCTWEAPIPYPNSHDAYGWDEETQSWAFIKTLEQAQAEVLEGK